MWLVVAVNQRECRGGGTQGGGKAGCGQRHGASEQWGLVTSRSGIRIRANTSHLIVLAVFMEMLLSELYSLFSREV